VRRFAQCRCKVVRWRTANEVSLNAMPVCSAPGRALKPTVADDGAKSMIRAPAMAAGDLGFKEGAHSMGGFKDPDFLQRQSAAANAKKAALERYRAGTAADNPAVAERAAARQAVATAREQRAAARQAAKGAAALAAAKEAERAREAAKEVAREAAAAAERERAEQAAREAALEGERKAARDARYAARKDRQKKKK
jgi:hypothetical protein